jgi:hypothetical protein
VYETRDDARAYGELGAAIEVGEEAGGRYGGAKRGRCALKVGASVEKIACTGARDANRLVEGAIRVRLSGAVLRPRF